MNYTTHRIGGVITGIITGVIVSETNDFSLLSSIALSTAVASVSSLVPDIDHPKSKISKNAKTVSKVINFGFGHRGFIHTPFCLMLLSSIIYVLSMMIFENNVNFVYPITFGFVSGYISHLLLDMLTPSGVMLFFPISTKKYRIIGLKSRKRDKYVSLLMMLIFVFFIGFYFKGVL